jgi:hypothetical protein
LEQRINFMLSAKGYAKQAESKNQEPSNVRHKKKTSLCLFLAVFVVYLPENEENTSLRHTCKLLLKYPISQPRGQYCNIHCVPEKLVSVCHHLFVPLFLFSFTIFARFSFFIQCLASETMNSILAFQSTYSFTS